MEISKIKKRNGLIVDFDRARIERAIEKAHQDYRRDVTQLRDIVRATIEVKSLEDAEKALAAIKERFGEPSREIKNRVARPGADGYRDIMLNVRLPSGIEAEIHHRASAGGLQFRGPGQPAVQRVDVSAG